MKININKIQARLLYDLIDIEIDDVRKANKERRYGKTKLYDYVRYLKRLKDKVKDEGNRDCYYI